jgi:hypothetical protein
MAKHVTGQHADVPQRYSIATLRCSIQPSSPSRRANAAIRALHDKAALVPTQNILQPISDSRRPSPSLRPWLGETVGIEGDAAIDFDQKTNKEVPKGKSAIWRGPCG